MQCSILLIVKDSCALAAAEKRSSKKGGTLYYSGLNPAQETNIMANHHSKDQLGGRQPKQQDQGILPHYKTISAVATSAPVI